MLSSLAHGVTQGSLLPVTMLQMLQSLIGHANVQAIVLADKHSVAAAKELSTLAVARHPHSKALAKRHAALRASPAGPASKTDANL